MRFCFSAILGYKKSFDHLLRYNPTTYNDGYHYYRFSTIQETNLFSGSLQILDYCLGIIHS